MNIIGMGVIEREMLRRYPEHCPFRSNASDINVTSLMSYRKNTMRLIIMQLLAYRIGESVDLLVHGKPYLSPHHSDLLECLPTQYTGEEFRLSPRCMDDFRFSDVT